MLYLKIYKSLKYYTLSKLIESKAINQSNKLFIKKISSVKYLSMINVENQQKLKIKISITNINEDSIFADVIIYNCEKAIVKIADIYLVTFLNIN